MDGPQATPDVSPTGLPVGYLASSLAQLLEVARRELEHRLRHDPGASLPRAEWSSYPVEATRKSSMSRSSEPNCGRRPMTGFAVLVDRLWPRGVRKTDAAIDRRSRKGRTHARLFGT
jgi:hypothetical protein